MHYLRTLISIVVINSILTSAYAAKITVPQCPTKITVTQNVTGHYAGWRVFKNEVPHFLTGIHFYSHQPEESANLKPETANDARAVWHFAATDKIFLVCQYNQTSTQLTQALPDQLTQCTVSYDKTTQGENGPLPDHITCH